jgi:type IV pilus assembly protein PilX
MLRPVDQPRHRLATASSNRQQGVVLLVALIVLVALTLAGVALVRSVDTANLVAGNLSFHQSAIQAGERSTELAVTWLTDPNNSQH